MARATAAARSNGREAELIAEILAAPDDDAPRMIYADWLEEHGSPRAELVRVQWERAHTHQSDPRWKRLDARATALMKRHEREWLGALQPLVSADPTFYRGLVCCLQTSAGTYAQAKQQQLFAKLLPTLGVEQTMLRGQSKRLGTCAALAWTSELWWWDCQLDDATLGAFVTSPHLTRLSSLTLEKVRCTSAGLERLAASTQLPRLRRFALPAPVHLGSFDARGVLAVLASPHFAIEELRIETAFDVKAGDLASAALGRLKKLELTVYGDVMPFARCRHFSALRNLILKTSGSFSDEVVLALLDNPSLAQLKWLDLRARMPAISSKVMDRLRERFGESFRQPR